MTDQKSKAPALDNGLDILERVCEAPAGFNELLDSLNMSRGSVARLLKILESRGYLERDDEGKYAPGPAIPRLNEEDGIKQRLQTRALPLMRKLTAATRCSSIIFYWDGRGFESLAKRTDENGPAMQELGTISTDLCRYPWGWLIYVGMTKESRAKTRKMMSDPRLVKRGLECSRPWLDRHGVAYDDQVVDLHQRRLATLIRSRDSRIVGALALGGNPLIMPNDKIAGFAQSLAETAGAV